MKRINELYQNVVFEKDEHKKTAQYKKLSPKMRDAVDFIFKIITLYLRYIYVKSII